MTTKSISYWRNLYSGARWLLEISWISPRKLAELRQLRNLAPGDFRTVRQEHFYLGDAVTNLDRIEALKEECAVKKDGDSRAPIGFAA